MYSLGVARGTGTPKDRDEVNMREFLVCDGWQRSVWSRSYRWFIDIQHNPLCTSVSGPSFINQSIKRKLNTRLTRECRFDERQKAKVEGSTRLTYIGWHGELEHLKIETRLIVTKLDHKREVSECDGWVCDLDVSGASSIFKIIRNVTTLTKMFPTFDLNCEENTTRL